MENLRKFRNISSFQVNIFKLFNFYDNEHEHEIMYCIVYRIKVILHGQAKKAIAEHGHFER